MIIKNTLSDISKKVRVLFAHSFSSYFRCGIGLTFSLFLLLSLFPRETVARERKKRSDKGYFLSAFDLT